MRKILTIAAREYKAMVGTKAFVISIVMMPVLMLGSLIAMQLLKNTDKSRPRRIAVIDHTQTFADVLQPAADQRNQALDDLKKSEQETSKEAMRRQSGLFSQDKYLLEWIAPEELNDELRLSLSDRIRNQKLYAFIEIPKSVLETNLEGESAKPEIRFYAQDASLSDAKGWFSSLINQEIKTRRLKAANIDPKIVALASETIPVVGLGLAERGSDGSVSSEAEKDALSALFLPLGVMLLMFMVIFMAAQPMLESVLEEKSQRIAEVLLGSVSSFQLMLGKLLGTVAGSLTVFLIYLVGMYGFAVSRGMADQIPFQLAPWFIFFQVMGVLFYAAIFMAIGASVSQLKEAQSMLLPVWMMMMSPMFVWLVLVRDPQGPTAVYFSMFPPAAPTAMMLRLATGQTIPIWQPIVAGLLTAVSTLFVVYVAARIFRVGILWQGKTPKLHEIAQWAFKG